ncbi:MAG: hypothetical protein C0616_07310 [Desulfuromonas sp.]|nr:MAG: hypothetical protein C0616_07310 [Desulfuromonas sp.]
MWIINRLIKTLLVCCLLSVFPLNSQADVRLKGEVVWEGDVVLKEATIVEADASLTIKAGTRVQVLNPQAKLTIGGGLQALGTADRPVRFEAPGWVGIHLVEPRGESRFSHVHFENAETAISAIAARFSVKDSRFDNCKHGINLLRESGPLIAGNHFSGGEIGIDIEMRSYPKVTGNRFEQLSKVAIYASHNSKGLIEQNKISGCQVGVQITQPYPDRVLRNHFVDNKVGIFCNQTKNTPQIDGNVFENNEKGVVNFSFAYPTLTNNRFVGNDKAVHNDQYGSALIEFNAFSKNETAIYNNRKSNPKIRHNNFEQNKLVLFCDYSSYPLVRQNNFLSNPEVVRLGIYQSADWEKRSGSKRLMMAESQARKTRNTMLTQAPTEFVDKVDVAENFWGDQNQRIAAARDDANLDLFWDRHDQPKVVYEGFGPDEYVLDLVVFRPPLPTAVEKAGPQK